MAQQFKLGYTLSVYSSGSQYRHAKVVVYRVEETYSGYLSKDTLVEFEWQTNMRHNGTWAPYYAGKPKIGKVFLREIENVNYFANFWRKVLRKLDDEMFSEHDTGPMEIIDALEKMWARRLVEDARAYDDLIWAKDAKPDSFKGYRLRQPVVQTNYTLKYFLAETEQDAKDQALAWLVDRAKGYTPDSQRVQDVAHWISQGMPLEEMHADAPDTRDAEAILSWGGEMAFETYHGEPCLVDGTPIEHYDESEDEPVFLDTLQEMADALGGGDYDLESE